MKRILYFLCFIIFFIPICGEAIVSPTNEFYINDYANILSVETEEYILQRSLALHAADGTQIVVVTVLNLEGMSLEKYANDLFNSFGIGDSEKDNGLLLLLALEEREFRVEVGDGLSGILPDGKTGRFQDNYIIPYLREDKWDEGIKNGYDAFYAEIVELNNLEVDYNRPISQENDNDLNEFGSIILIFIVPALLGGIVGTFVNIRPRLGERGVHNKAKKIKIFVFIFIIVILLMILFLYLKMIYLTNALFYFLLFFLIASVGGVDFLKMSTDGGHYHGSRSGRSSSGFSGGGGRSIGGGSSRRF